MSDIFTISLEEYRNCKNCDAESRFDDENVCNNCEDFSSYVSNLMELGRIQGIREALTIAEKKQRESY